MREMQKVYEELQTVITPSIPSLRRGPGRVKE
jgi:hypothetical protein